MGTFCKKLYLLAAALCTVANVVAAKYDTRIDGIYYTLQADGKAAVVAGDDKYTGTVTIPEVIECAAGEYAVTSIAPRAFAGCKEVKEIAYGSSITMIGAHAFQGCEGLTHFTILPTITFIDNFAFENTGITEIIIPQSIANIGNAVWKGCKNLHSAQVENKIIGEEQFANCVLLGIATISENVTSIKKKAFARCVELQTITIPVNINKIESEVFTGCEKLQSAVILNRTIGAKQFVGCKILAQVTLSEALTSIEEKAFSGCLAITEFHTPAGLQIIGDEAFMNCSGMTTVELGPSLTHVGKKAFSGTAIEQLQIPANIKTFGNGTFQGCKNLQRVALDNACLSEAEFQGCDKLQQVSLQAQTYRIPKNAFNGCTALTDIPFPQGMAVVENNAFHACKDLEEIILPASIEQIEGGAFSGCAALKHIRCYAVQIPKTGSNAFSGIAKEGLKVEVPAESVEPYKLAAGWKALQPKEGQVFFPIE